MFFPIGRHFFSFVMGSNYSPACLGFFKRFAGKSVHIDGLLIIHGVGKKATRN